MGTNANLEQIKHIRYYAKYHHITDMEIAALEWVSKFAKLFRMQYENRGKL